MFDVNCRAEIRAITVRMETAGDMRVPAVDVKMLLMGVPVDAISSACPDMGERFYAGGAVAIGEVNPLTVCHSIENLAVNIGGQKVNACDIKKGAKINLQPEKVANVEVTVQARNRGDLILKVLEMLKDEVAVTIVESQLSLVEMQQ